MNNDVAAHHRLLTVVYRRYLDADLVLTLAMDDMRSFFPPTAHHIATRLVRRGLGFVAFTKIGIAHCFDYSHHTKSSERRRRGLSKGIHVAGKRFSLPDRSNSPLRFERTGKWRVLDPSSGARALAFWCQKLT